MKKIRLIFLSVLVMSNIANAWEINTHRAIDIKAIG